MKKFINLPKLLIIISYLTLRFQVSYGTDKGGKAIFSQLESGLYQVKTLASEVGSKLSYGTGFVVDKKQGLLLTNYHVISEKVFDEHDHYQVYIENDHQNKILAKIINFSVIHDLAVIKVDPNYLKGELSIKEDPPVQGEPIYSLGLPQSLRMAIVEGVYNGVVENDLYPTIFMTTPINSGMSGGPTVNSEGQVVGVNVSTLRGSNNITFSVPIRFAMDLLLNAKNPSLNYDEKNYYKIIREQLGFFENRLLQKMSSQKFQSSNKLKLSNWRLPPVLDELECWGKKHSGEKGDYATQFHRCFMKNAAYISSNIFLGYLSLEYQSIKNNNLLPIQFYSMITSSLGGAGLKFSLLNKTSNNEEITPYNCSMRTIVNKHGLTFKVNSCISGLIKFSDLYLGSFRIISWPYKEEVLLVNYTIYGASKNGLWQFIYHHLNNINVEVK